HVIGDAVHHLPMLAIHLGMQAAEIREARRGAGAAEKAVALDEHRGTPCPARRGCGGNAGRSAAQHDDFILAHDRRPALRLCYFAAHLLARHSTTRSARRSTVDGIVSPRALAVLTLTVNSNFVGCSIGSSA